MDNTKLSYITVDGVVYGYMWFDFGDHLRFDAYQETKRIGFRKLPIDVDKQDDTITYLIRRMIGNYGPFRFPHIKRE